MGGFFLLWDKDKKFVFKGEADHWIVGWLSLYESELVIAKSQMASCEYDKKIPHE